MRDINKLNDIKDTTTINSNSLKSELLKAYQEACKDPDFIKLVTKLKLKEEKAMKYTSKLERSVCELKNCKNCKGLAYCKNSSQGYVYYPRVDEERVQFDAIACKYKQDLIKLDATTSKMYYQPASIKYASMKDIDKKDKKRLEAIKWIVNFYKEYKNNKNK